MVGEADFKTIAESPELRNLLSLSFEDTIPYEEFVTLPMPAGCDPHDIWDFVMAVMHCSGETRNLKPWRKDVDTDVCWSYETKRMRRDLHHIALLACPGSALNNFVLAHAEEKSLIAYVIQEVAHCARFDGVNVTERAVGDIWMHHRAPANDDERVIGRVAKVFSLAPRLAGVTPYSRLLIADIQEALRSESAMGAKPIYHWDCRVVDAERAEDIAYANQLLDFELKLTRSAVDVQDVVKAAVFASTAMRDVRYVPALRNLTEYLLRVIFFFNRNMPSLAYVPATSIFDSRMGEEKRNYASDSVRCPKEGLFTNWMHWGMTRAYREGIDMVAEMAEGFEKSDQARRAAIAKIPQITLRQRAFLGTASLHPSRWYKIREYADAYDVSYSTARSDLNELVSRGYLSMSRIGRAFCYQAVSLGS